MRDNFQRVTEAARELLISPHVDLPFSKQGQPKWVAEVCVHLCFKYLQRCRFHNLSVQPAPMFDHPHIEKFSVFLAFKWNFMFLISDCAYSLLSSPETSLRRVQFDLFSFLLDIYAEMRSPKPFCLQDKQSQLSQPLFLFRFSSPLSILMAIQRTYSSISMYLQYWKAQSQAQGRDHLP